MSEFIDKQKREVTYLLYDGTKINEELPENRKFRIIGKVVETANLIRYYIRTSSNKLFDPKIYNEYQLKNDIPRFVEVKSNIYELYEKYINNESRTTISSIERLL